MMLSWPIRSLQAVTLWGTMATAQRDALLWPFAQDSIWNMPIGDQAVYVAAGIQAANRMTIDEDIIVLTPTEPLTDIYFSNIGWTNGPARCNITTSTVLFEVPVPSDFVVSPATWDGSTPNSGLAALQHDGETIVQTQPFARCTMGGDATSLTSQIPPLNITGDGIRGAHGGSGLSAIGGTLRMGELVPDGVIRHALKVNLWGERELFQGSSEPDGNLGFRWPAVRADTGFDDPGSNNYYGGSNPSLQMGSLLALHPSEDLSSLPGNSLGIVTESALILARAFQDYGAYVVDNTARDVYALCTEWGPAGNVNTEHEATWGYPINPPANPVALFKEDMDRIFTNLYVVDNNSPTSIGGGGTPRVPLAPPFSVPSSPTPMPPTPVPATPVPLTPAPPTTNDPAMSSCFSGENLVEVRGKGSIRMKDLNVGDFVQVLGDRGFSQVYSFAHLDREALATFTTIHVEGNEGSPLELTPDHMLYRYIPSDSKIRVVAASKIRVGDMLVGSDGEQVKVTDIGEVSRRGIFAPFTTSGNVVVNKVLASSYVSLYDEARFRLPMSFQSMAHAVLAPHRLICAAHFAWCQNETYSSQGISDWLSIFVVVLTQPPVVSVPLFVAMGPFILTCNVVELFMNCTSLRIVTAALLGTLACFSWKRTLRKKM